MHVQYHSGSDVQFIDLVTHIIPYALNDTLDANRFLCEITSGLLF